MSQRLQGGPPRTLGEDPEISETAARPIEPLYLEDDPPEATPETVFTLPRVRNIGRAQLGLTLIGLVGALVEIEFILGAGPIVFAFALALSVLAGRLNRRALVAWGGLGMLFPALTFLVILIGNISPSQAEVPVPMAGALFFVVGVVLLGLDAATPDPPPTY